MSRRIRKQLSFRERLIHAIFVTRRRIHEAIIITLVLTEIVRAVFSFPTVASPIIKPISTRDFL